MEFISNMSLESMVFLVVSICILYIAYFISVTFFDTGLKDLIILLYTGIRNLFKLIKIKFKERYFY